MDPKHTNVIDCSNSDEEDILIPSDSEFSSIDASDNENSSQASSEERPPISSEDPVPPPPKRSKRDGDIIRNYESQALKKANLFLWKALQCCEKESTGIFNGKITLTGLKEAFRRAGIPPEDSEIHSMLQYAYLLKEHRKGPKVRSEDLIQARSRQVANAFVKQQNDIHKNAEYLAGVGRKPLVLDVKKMPAIDGVDECLFLENILLDLNIKVRPDGMPL